LGFHKFGEFADGYSKMQTYKGMLLGPARNMRNNLGVSGLTIMHKGPTIMHK